MMRRWFARMQPNDAQDENAAGAPESKDAPAVPEPLSRNWGYDRGQPVDRYYIEGFLHRHSRDVRGRVLEIGDNAYTLRFGGSQVAHSDVLHVTPGYPNATYIGDLTRAEHIPSDEFDCIILTQTLQLIYDVPAALRTVRRILKPGGVLLVTVPGLTRTSQVEWPNSWYWRYTRASAERIFRNVFPDAEIETHGNVLAACAFLYGAATQELAPEDLDAHDADYDVIITVRAQKPAIAAPVRNNRAPSDVATRPALVLLYHRISEPGLDPWQLSVSPAHFAEQLAVLTEDVQIVPLRELKSARTSEERDGAVVAITFDDGYADNLFEALPLLEQYRAPATMFINTGPVAREEEFWWDVLERVLLEPNKLPNTLSQNIGGQRFTWDLSDCADYTERTARAHAGWRVGEPALTSRQELFLALWEQLMRMEEQQRTHALRSLLRWAGEAGNGAPRHRALTRAELQRLAWSPLIDVGAHTESHTALSALSLVQQAAEITGSARWIEGAIGRPPVAFSYPFGRAVDYTVDTMRLAREAGFDLACSNIADVVRDGADPLQLPRIHVPDVGGAAFRQLLQGLLARQ